MMVPVHTYVQYVQILILGLKVLPVLTAGGVTIALQVRGLTSQWKDFQALP